MDYIGINNLVFFLNYCLFNYMITKIDDHKIERQTNTKNFLKLLSHECGVTAKISTLIMCYLSGKCWEIRNSYLLSVESRNESRYLVFPILLLFVLFLFLLLFTFSPVLLTLPSPLFSSVLSPPSSLSCLFPPPFSLPILFFSPAFIG
jgi:hypothetical protein